MKRLVIINGSPKKTNSASSKLAQEIIALLPALDIHPMISALQVCNGAKGSQQALEQALADADILLFIFPLYADGLPARLLQMMSLIPAAISRARGPLTVYAMCNCGFYESAHTHLALRMVAHFCADKGFDWQGGIGIGGGEIIDANKPLCHSPTQHIYRALRILVERINAGERNAEVLSLSVEPPMPRWVYRALGSLRWLVEARGNGVLLPLLTSLWRKPAGTIESRRSAD
ncbi:NAD(P)H-dependent oxidoreductase [Edwardsiella tarda]|uniref:NAD(P)H-dependent oxidoreductase n=1 Tax=Edwardsiella tarda TaxID=636 RepID=UPI00083B4691|nr:NAD(P)H-dependent oxidoreductase [Edwardsiella tarda]